MRNRFRFAMVIAMTGILSGAAGAGDGDPARIALLELYTSEGCNSCPPTDAWVSSLSPQLVPQKLVVLAFHVDYWNYLGWPDRFSQARFSQRQQASVRYNGLRTAYTPQLLLNGRDYRERGDIEAQVARIHAQPAHVQLSLNITRTSGTLNTKAVIRPTQIFTNQPLQLYLAVYENNLHSDVKSGENRGRRLRHDYVVRSLTGPIEMAGKDSLHWDGKLTLSPEWKTADLGLAAFVQSSKTGEILQVMAKPIQAQ